ncbi:MAG: four helix bundle protein [Bacteroidia bacterium]|nr:four helix bundle protein [Bacteroidia bacterium]
MRDFKKLKIWEKGMDITINTYHLSLELPNDERFGLARQIKRSARSIPANIAEGSSRRSEKDYARFLEIAEGSSFELETDLLIMQRLEMGPQDKIESLLIEIDQEQKMIAGFRRKLEI